MKNKYLENIDQTVDDYVSSVHNSLTILIIIQIISFSILTGAPVALITSNYSSPAQWIIGILLIITSPISIPTAWFALESSGWHINNTSSKRFAEWFD